MNQVNVPREQQLGVWGGDARGGASRGACLLIIVVLADAEAEEEAWPERCENEPLQ